MSIQVESQSPSYHCLRGWGAYCGLSDEYLPPFFFSLSLSPSYLTLFLCLGHSCRMCPSKRPRQAEAPPGLECKGEEAEKQKLWGHCSRHRANSSWSSEGPQCQGPAGAPGSVMLLPEFVSMASCSPLILAPHPSHNPVS